MSLHDNDDRQHEDAQIKQSHHYNPSLNGNDDDDTSTPQPLTRRTQDTRDDTATDTDATTPLPPHAAKTGWNTTDTPAAALAGGLNQSALSTTSPTQATPNAIKYGRRQHQLHNTTAQQYDTIDDNLGDTAAGSVPLDGGVVDTYVDLVQHVQAYGELNDDGTQQALPSTVDGIDISLLLITVQQHTKHIEMDEPWDHITLWSTISSAYIPATDSNDNSTNRQSYIDSETVKV